MPSYEIHEAANIFPPDDENIPELAADIKKNGQKVAIELFEGKVLDGRRRIKACEVAGIEPKYRTVEVDDPVAYVLSLNLHRRHLSESQRGMIAAKALEIYKAAAKERQKASGGDRKSGTAKSVSPNRDEPIQKGRASEQAGKAVGTSRQTVERAAQVLRECVPEVVQAVEEGRITVHAAVNLVDEPEEVQKEAAMKTPAERKVKPKEEPEEEPKKEIKLLGRGVEYGHNAVNWLQKIPRNDPLRMRGFQIVTDWIKQNK